MVRKEATFGVVAQLIRLRDEAAMQSRVPKRFHFDLES
jgi:hypothetical protein